jgi:tRNA(Ile)-lysidine synthase
VLTLEAEPDLSKSLFSQIDLTGGVVAAVSGGSDSTALLLLLQDHLQRTAPATKLLAVTIDHDLRPDAAAEARAVATLCATRGIAHRTLVWSGPKPLTGLPAAAREARYRLLAQAAQDSGIGLILTGHTADDQAETVLMRMARDKGRGLAGMAPATLYDWRCWIVRPLLGMRRAALRDMLSRRAVGWADDPTNVDMTFERPRIRLALAGATGAGRFDEAVARAAHAATAREQLGYRAATLIRSIASRPAAGLIRLDPGFATAGDGEAAVYALRILIATIGGVAFLADQTRSKALFDRLSAGPLCATLSRTVVDARRTGIFLRRESRDLPAEVVALDNALWDNRRRITLDDRTEALLVAPLGAKAAAECTVAEDGPPPSLVRAALATEPVLWRKGECSVRSPGEHAPQSAALRPIVAPFARFLPSFDLEPAAAVAALIGAAPFPARPFSGHSAG